MSRQQLFYTTTQQCVVSERIYHKTGLLSRGNKRRQIFMRALRSAWLAEGDHKKLTPVSSDLATFESPIRRSVCFLSGMRSVAATRPTTGTFVHMINYRIA